MVVYKIFLFTDQFHQLHVKDSSQITIIDDAIMTASELEMGYKHVPLIKPDDSTDKENGSINVKVNV